MRAALIGLVTLGTGARIWVLMAVSGLPVTFASVAPVMLSLGVFGLLPLGPGSSPAGTVASLGVSGTAAIGSALVLGIAVSATSICAVGVYALAVGTLLAGGRAADLCCPSTGDRRAHPDPARRGAAAGGGR